MANFTFNTNKLGAKEVCVWGNIHDRFTVVNMSVTVGKVALTCVSLHMHVLVCFLFSPPFLTATPG